MKRILCCIVIFTLSLTLLCSCKKASKKESEKETEVESVTFEDVYGDVDFRSKLTLFQYDDFSKYITLADYKGLEYPASLNEITDDEIDNYINAILEESGYGEETTVTDRPVQNGDTVNIDFEGKRDGVAFEGGTSAGYDLVIGSSTFIEGFEEGLVGVKTGETVDLDLSFPDSYHNAELAGQPVVFTVTVNSIKSVILPELTDEIVAEISECKSVSEYREVVRTMLKEDTDFSVLNELFPKVLEASTFAELPETEYNFFVDYVVNDYVNNYGVSADDELVQNAAKESADQLVRYYLMYYAIFEAEGMQITDKEFEKAFAKGTAANSLDEEAAKEMNLDIFYMSLVYEKVADFILKNSVAVD